MRKLQLVLLLLALGLPAVVAGAASFDDSTPCPVNGALFVCPSGTVGVPYILQLTGRFGCERYWFRVDSGMLPPGLTMTRDGLVSGTPTSAVRTTPWISIHDLLLSEGGFDWCAGDNQSERQFAFEIAPAPSPPPVVLPYYWHLTAAGVLLHSQRAISYADGSSGLSRMLTWMQGHKDTIRVRGSVSLAHVRASG